jgi:murein DD-endopeptidase MepM/ murein hydrolase activator NlpD
MRHLTFIQSRAAMLILVISFALAVMIHAGSAEAATLFRLPLSSNPGYSAWFDHNAASGSLLKYQCSTSFQYDNHHGTDFPLAMGNTVYAGASGALYYRVDGCPDGSSPSCGGGYGNHVRIEHPSDWNVSIYAHMKNGTVAFTQSLLCSKNVGQSGNSGTGTGPHLHFELWDHSGIGTRLDFFSGACNATGYWVNQNGGWPTTQCQ